MKLGLALLIVISLPAISHAESSSKTSLGEKIENTSTGGKEFVSKYFRTLSAEIDAFFSSRRTSYLTNTSQFRISNITTVREDIKPTNESHLSFNIILPETQKRASLVFEREPRRLESPEKPGDVQPAQAPEEEKKSQTAASLRYFLLLTDNTTISSDAGVQFEPPIQPFGRLRASRSVFPNKKWEIRGSEEIYYFFVDRWRLSTSLDSDHTLSSNLLFRLGNTVTWYQISESYEYLYGPSLFQRLSATRGLGYHFKVLASSQPVWQNINMTASIVYRQSIIKDWFFYELVPAVDFPRERDWKATSSLSLKFEAVF